MLRQTTLLGHSKPRRVPKTSRRFKKAYRRLPDTDTILRSTITHACAINYSLLESHEDVMAVMKKYERAVWNAAEFIAKVNASRMMDFTEKIATNIGDFRTCRCGETGLAYPDATMKAGIISIDIGCLKCDENLRYKSR
jgi:hypothetical protein